MKLIFSLLGIFIRGKYPVHRLRISVTHILCFRIVEPHLFPVCFRNESTDWRDSVQYPLWHCLLGSHGKVKHLYHQPHSTHPPILQVYPMGFGQGSAGLNGTGFQLLIIIFMLLFGVSLGQVVSALSPSIQVSWSHVQTSWHTNLLGSRSRSFSTPFLLWSCPLSVVSRFPIQR